MQFRILPHQNWFLIQSDHVCEGGSYFANLSTISIDEIYQIHCKDDYLFYKGFYFFNGCVSESTKFEQEADAKSFLENYLIPLEIERRLMK